MTGDAFAPILIVFAMTLMGLVLGIAYFRALQRTADLLAARSGWLAPAGLTLARLLGAVIFLILIARLGAMALLAGLLGFLLARVIALRAARRTG